MSGTKHIDPALCIYIGASLICIDNKHMKDNVPRGNGTLCRVLGVKLREKRLTMTDEDDNNNEDGNGATGIEVDDDGDDFNCGNVRR
jgi:3-methyladenine DNA glycosylase Mpg